MKFTIIYKESLMRPRHKDIEAESFDSLELPDAAAFLGTEPRFLYGVIDWEAKRFVPAVVDRQGKIIEVPDGDFGEQTPAEYFEEQA